MSEQYEPDLTFGECVCGEPLERPFWDRYCFACQDEQREEDEARNQRLYEEDVFLYSVPIRDETPARGGDATKENT